MGKAQAGILASIVKGHPCENGGEKDLVPHLSSNLTSLTHARALFAPGILFPLLVHGLAGLARREE